MPRPEGSDASSRVVRAAEGNRAWFDALHTDEHGLGWCQCVAWWVAGFEGWGERTAEENRALREDLFARGVHDGYFLVADERPVAWAQVAPRDALGRVARAFGRPPDPGAWAVGCLAVPPRERRRGRARALLRGVLADVARRGATGLEAFPKDLDGASCEEGELWNGPLELYRELGFEVVDRVPPRLVVRRAISGASLGRAEPPAT